LAPIYTVKVKPQPKSDDHFTDVGNAQRFARWKGPELRYCSAWGKWLTWDGKRWEVDDTGKVFEQAKDVVRRMYNEACFIEDDTYRGFYVRHALRSEGEGRLKAMVELARSAEEVRVKPDQLDADAMLLNCNNGTVDLRTGELRHHRRSDLITKLAPVDYDPRARCPVFERFIQRIFDGNPDLLRYVQRCIGYALTGDVGEKALFFFYGTGDNGKTTLLEVVRVMLGDYAGQIPIDTLMLKPQGGIPNDIALLKGLRFVTSSETEEGQRLASAKIKYLTGMNTIQARFLHREFFDFPPTHKIFFDANHQPHANASDTAVWNRIKLIPFGVSIPDAEKDRHLGDKLRGEVPGILAWAVRGCLEWQSDGLQEPDVVKNATQAYRDEMDTFQEFLEDCCVIGPGETTAINSLYLSYRLWAEGSGEQPVSKKQLGKLVTRNKSISQARTGGGRFWTGIGLRSGRSDWSTVAEQEPISRGE
jgi:putative DNA primase/helicase